MRTNTYFKYAETFIVKGLRLRFFINILCVLIFSLEQTVWASETQYLHKASANAILTKKNNVDNTTWQAYKHPRFSHRFSPLTGLPVLADQETALPSNATNFNKIWNTSVDSRTGASSFSFTVARLLFDYDLGHRNLTLSYDGGPSAGGPDTFGLGSHWSWNVGSEHPSTSEVAGHMTTDIVTGSGHHFTMVNYLDEKGKTVWRPLRHKLKDVIIAGRPGNWTVSMSTGVREHLLNGYEDWEETRDGKRIWFYYDHENIADRTRHLAYLCVHPRSQSKNKITKDAYCQGNYVNISYLAGKVVIHGQQEVSLNMKIGGEDRKIMSIDMPLISTPVSKNNTKTSHIYFTYDDMGNRPWLLRKVSYPTGYATMFLYNEEALRHDSQFTAGLHTGINNARIPVVTEQITHFDTPDMADRRIWFSYERPHVDEHNYTGYQGNNTVLPGRDNLMDREDDYTYSVTKDDGFTKIITTYNKYHLPLGTVRTENNTGKIIDEQNMTYPGWKKTTFNQLPAVYSLPIKNEKIFYDYNNNGPGGFASVRIIQAKKYDNYGHVVWEKDPYGRQTFFEYCLPEGDSHCPKSDKDWPAGDHPEKVLMVSSRHKFGKNADDDSIGAIEQIYDYSRFRSKVISYDKNQSEKAKYFWQVHKKTVLTLPFGAVSHLVPGKRLPEFDSGTISTETAYKYETNKQNYAYGQLKSVSVIKYPHKRSLKAGRYSIKMNLTAPFDLYKPESTSLIIDHRLDLKAGTMTTTVSGGSGNKRNPYLANNRYSYGSTVYSIKTGRKIAAYDPLELFHTFWGYDLWNRVVSMTVKPATGGKPKTTRWTYSQENNGVIGIVTSYPDGSSKKNTVSGTGERLSQWHRFRGDKSWIPDSAITYTRTGKVDSKIVWHAGDSENGQPGKTIALVTRYGYDNLNRPIWVKYPDNSIQITAYDDFTTRTISYRLVPDNHDSKTMRLSDLMNITAFNILGKPTAVYALPLRPDFKKNGKSVYHPGLKVRLRTLRSYLKRSFDLILGDNYRYRGLPLSGKNGLLVFTRSAIASGCWLNRALKEYDGFGRLARNIQSNGAITRYIWREGNRIAIIMPDGRLVHDTINIQGHKISRCVRPSNGSVCHVLGYRGFDSSGNMLWQTNETGLTTRFRYDADNQLITMITPGEKSAPGGHVFSYRYNSFGIAEADLDGKPYVRYYYDPVTWKLVDKEDKVSHIHYKYDDNNGNLIQVTYSTPTFFRSTKVNYPEYTVFFKWNRYGQMESFTDPSGNLYISRHDVFGRVIRKMVQSRKQRVPGLLSSIEYDVFGRRLRTSNGLGINRFFSYDKTGHLASTTDRLNGQLLQKLSYIYDYDTGNITSITRKEPGGRVAVKQFDYDLQHNLKEMRCTEKGTVDDSSSLCPRDTSIQGKGSTLPPIILSQHYRFDQWNNIHSVNERLREKGKVITKTTLYSYAGSPDNKQTQGYDPHRLTAISTLLSTDKQGNPPKTITYNELGQIISDTEGNKLHYNAFGLQDLFTNIKSGIVTRYIYDSNGHQISSQSFGRDGKPTKTPLYIIYSGNKVVAQAQKDHYGKTHMSVELDSLAHSEDGIITQWYLHNYKGDVIKVFNSKGGMLQNNVYSPYGMEFNVEQKRFMHTLPNINQDNAKGLWIMRSPGFNGEFTDRISGYQFLGAGYRAYNPQYRHFMSKDSESPFNQIDGYGFANNNPVMNTDPSGHSAQSHVDLVMGFMSIASSAVMVPLFLVSAAGLFFSGGISGAVFVMTGSITLLLSGTNVLSGILQMATHGKKNKTIDVIVSNAFGFGSVASLALQSGTLFAMFQSHPDKLFSFFMVLSATGMFVNMLATLGYFGLRCAMMCNKDLSSYSGLQTIMQVVGFASTLISVALAIGGVLSIKQGAGFAMSAYKARREANLRLNFGSRTATLESDPLISGTGPDGITHTAPLIPGGYGGLEDDRPPRFFNVNPERGRVSGSGPEIMGEMSMVTERETGSTNSNNNNESENFEADMSHLSEGVLNTNAENETTGLVSGNNTTVDSSLGELSISRPENPTQFDLSTNPTTESALNLSPPPLVEFTPDTPQTAEDL